MTASAKARILIVEDEEDWPRGIRENLQDEGYESVVEGDGEAALARALEEDFDLLLLDVMLPGLDGFTICERIRHAGRDVPVLFLTARGTLDDRLRGLGAGGDDYLPKPFHLGELLARIEAILRRRLWLTRGTAGKILTFGDNEIDLATREVKTWDGAHFELTTREAGVLAALAAEPGETVTRETILEKVWGRELLPSTRAILAIVESLRSRLEREPEAPRHLHTVRGVGYRLTLEPEDPR
ncbi:MAG: response regulator transcription factor [Acidobacteriota bacterium]|nr:response regulator transcription factor [Acidobacteriota bacterium]